MVIPQDMPRLLYIVTHPMTARYLLCGQLAWMQKNGFDVSLISSPGPDLDVTAERERVAVFPLPIEREIHPLKDLWTLLRLYRLIRQIRPDMVNASTPKAGLLGMVAARIARVPLRIYTLRGLRLETKKGFARAILHFTEKVASVCATQIICVSESLRQRYLSLGIIPASKIRVLGAGSSNGVDVLRFASQESSAQKESLKQTLGIPPSAPVIGFVGRLVHDKGIEELVDAFESLRKEFPAVHLLVLGDFEKGDPVSAHFAAKLNEMGQIVRTGFVPDTAPYYGLMDLLVFPSHREGFPNVPLEASCSAIPTVGFRVTGTVDAVQDGVTGTLVNCGDVTAFTKAISMYLSDERLRREHGRAAYERVCAVFARERVWQGLRELYEQSLVKATALTV